VVLANLGSESETCVGSRVHLVGASIAFEKNFYRLPLTPPPSLVHRIGPSNSKARTLVARPRAQDGVPKRTATDFRSGPNTKNE
jgi:hypothetical protein